MYLDTAGYKLLIQKKQKKKKTDPDKGLSEAGFGIPDGGLSLLMERSIQSELQGEEAEDAEHAKSHWQRE